MLKTNGTELIDESADVCLHFSGHVTSPAFGRALSFCWNSRCVFSPFTLLPTTQFAYWKGLGTWDALLRVSQTLQSALESGQGARIVQIDFCAAFDKVNHLGILYESISSALWVLEVLSCLY